MLIKSDFEVGAPIDTVWRYFGDIPVVAACLPGAEITEDLGGDKYKGRVAVRMGPVKLRFGGIANITERNEGAKRIVVQASGAEEGGKGQAEMNLTAQLTGSGGGTRVIVTQDLNLSGAAAQYGRGMISDVTSVLMEQFAANLQGRIGASERGEVVRRSGAAKSASGLTIGRKAMILALKRVIRRFFAPYQPNPS
jgi:carbon monoxide dehydrogenase subunit G